MAHHATIITLLGAMALALVACGDGERYLTAEGYVEGDYILAGPKVQGRLEEVLVTEGDVVAQGDPLFRLDDTEQKALFAGAVAGVAQAEAELANLLSGKRPQEIDVIQAQLDEREAELSLAKLELARQQRLVRTGAGSKRALDEAKSQKDFSEASVRELQAQLETAKMPAREKEIVAAEARVVAAKAERDQTQYLLDQRTVLAPKAGTVEDIMHYPGEVVSLGTPVVSLLPPENRKLRFFVPQQYLSRLELTNDVAISCDGCASGLSGTVSFIASDAEYTPPVIFSSGSRDKLVWMVEVTPSFDAGQLKPGQPVQVRVDLDQTFAPAEAPQDPAVDADPVVDPAPVEDAPDRQDQSVEGAPVPQQGNPSGEDQEDQNGPQLGKDLGDTVPLQDDATDHAQEMGEG